MPARQLQQLLAMLMIGDGVLGLLAPRRQVATWLGGPRVWRAAMNLLLRHPGLKHSFAACELTFGIWLGARQWPSRRATAQAVRSAREPRQQRA